MDQSWWETTTVISNNFTCEIEQRLVSVTLNAREMDVLGNEVIERILLPRAEQANFLPASTNHICARLVLSTPVISQEFDNLSIRLREIESAIATKKTEIETVEDILRSRVILRDRETHTQRLSLLRSSVHDLQMDVYSLFYRRSQVRERVLKFERIRCTKVFQYLINFMHYHFNSHTGLKPGEQCIFDTHLSFLTIRQFYDATLVLVNFFKHSLNYEREDLEVVDRYVELDQVDDGIDVDEEEPRLVAIRPEEVDEIIPPVEN